MREETEEKKQSLRSGYTTGACATATSLAAATAVLNDKKMKRITITLPRGQNVEFKLNFCESLNSGAIASTTKDAGDDPDATHGATIFSEVKLSKEKGISFHAAEGVGKITRKGLSLPVGEPAINPVPRKMITDHLSQLAKKNNYLEGLKVYIGIIGGEEISLKTMNSRLGIIGGLSILGTTGIVRPFSCAAYIASIQNAIEVAHANGAKHIAASTGSTSEQYIKQHLNLPDIALIEMGDFSGVVLKHLKKFPIKKLSICGGFGKMTKMAAGKHFLHSKDSSIDFSFLANLSQQLGGDSILKVEIENANTSLEAFHYCQSKGIRLADSISQLAKNTAMRVSKNKLNIDVYCVDKSGYCLGNSLNV